MVDTSKAPAQLETKPVAELAKKRRMQPALTDSADLNESLVPSAGIDRTLSASPLEAKKRSRKKQKSERKRKLSSSGSVYKVNGDTHYRACIRFDALDIHTGQYDLQTALEYLVILTSVKQKMLDCTTKQSIPFHERLQEALIESAAEQGRDYADLDLRFAIHQPAGFLVAQGFQVRSPSVRSLSDLGKLRNCLRPFRKFAWKWGRSSIFWWYSPVQLQDAWESFQQAVATAWEIGGVDSTEYIGRIRARREANISVRNRHLQMWECRHMALQDKKPASSKKTANTCSLSQSDLGAAAYGQGGPDNTPTECSKNCPKAWGNLGCEAVSFEEAAWEMGTTVESRGTINGQRAPQTVPPAKEAQRRATKTGSPATENAFESKNASGEKLCGRE